MPTPNTKSKAKKPAAKAGKAAARKPNGASARRPAAPKKPAAPAAKAQAAKVDEGGYRLAEAARRLGPADPALERAVRSAHPDEELHAEGIRVATERILADGERICSKALVHLESKDADVQQAARKAGLTRPLVALTVDALRRLEGTRDQVEGEQGSRSGKRHTAAASIESVTAHGRSLKRQTLERLVLVGRADPALGQAIARASERAARPEQLATQLASLAQLVGGLASHPSSTVQALAAAKALGADDAAELTQASEAIAQASAQLTPADARREEKQALLDVLDGLCLVLLDDVLRAVRAMARATSKVRKPTLYSLQSYFGSRGKADEEPEPPAPAPA